MSRAKKNPDQLKEDALRRRHEDYYWLKEHGFCPKCGKNRPVGNLTLCPECLEKATIRNATHPRTKEQKERGNARRREVYAARTAAGLCGNCGRPAMPGRKRCSRCLAQNAEIKRRKAGLSRRFLGLCLDCGAEPVPGKCFCEKCLPARQENMKKNLSKFIERQKAERYYKALEMSKRLEISHPYQNEESPCQRA